MKAPDRRNPWIVLGVDYGCSPAEASVAFARKAKVLRRTTEGPWDRADLAWALNQIEATETDPTSSVSHYRVPADSAAYDVSTSELRPGLLNPQRPLVKRLMPPTTEADRQVVVQTLIRAVLRQVLASPPAPIDLCPYAVDGESPR